MILKELRQEILQSSRTLLAKGVISDGQGNLSAYHREEGLIAITPSAVPYQERELRDICVVEPDGSLVDGRWKPTSEMALHLVFYRERPDVEAVVHTHPPYTTVFGIIGSEPMPMVLNEAAMGLGGDVPVAPYGRPGTEELAEITCQAADGGTAAIMAHHGLVTVGGSLQQAAISTIAAEDTARAIILARSMGERVIALEDSEVNVLREMFLGYRPRRSDG
jgi:ribulose-5-phosphate 4-epimerase/fuculose-1-phosphate aldolase